jgi:ABC-type sugar transport system ATPase subunit
MSASGPFIRSIESGNILSPLFEINALTKSFPGVLAVDQVDMTITPGETLSLLGQNGAGKSTLIQILSGLHVYGTYTGEIKMDGEPFKVTSVSDAEARGVAFLAQEVNVAPNLTVAQTLWLHNEPTNFGFVDRAKMHVDALKALKNFNLQIDPDTEMGELDLATQQLVLIVRALSKNARLLILDEPTAALNEREAAQLFAHMKALNDLGVAIIFVSHRLAEVFEVSDRIVVMCDGQIAGDFTATDTDHDKVVSCMVGVKLDQSQTDRTHVIGAPALGVRNLNVMDAVVPERQVVHDASFDVHRGEIVGLFGLLGSGVVETSMAVFGAWRGVVSGRVLVDGKPVQIGNPAEAVHQGIGLIGQDRRDGLTGHHSIHDNAILASLDELSTRWGIVRRMPARKVVKQVSERLEIKAEDIDTEVGTLSGGNQQKVQIARWLIAGVKSLILIDPTRGVDVGARSQITRIWQELAQAGDAILLVSSDAEELLEICDRVIVFRNGQITTEIPRSELSEENLLRLAAGL